MPCTVNILTPNGKFVGAGNMQGPLFLEAVVDPPPIGFEEYSWSVVAGSGNGDFSDPTGQTADFMGSVRGPVTVQVEATTDEGTCDDTEQLTVIEVFDLIESVPPQQLDQVFINDPTNTYTIPYSDATGELRAVLIKPIQSYVYQGDYYADVNQQTGDVRISFLGDGPYLIKTIRDTGAEYLFELFYNSSVGDLNKHDSAETEFTTVPQADLVIISSGPEGPDNRFLGNARLTYGTGNFKAVGSVADVINEINAYWNAQGPNPQKFNIIIVDHSRAAYMGMGAGQAGQPSREIY